MALPRQHRLRLEKEIKAVKEKGKMFSAPFFNLLLFASPGHPSRFAFLVSKKIDSRAVVRNRIRRVLSEGIRLNLARIKPGFLFLFLVKRGIKGKETALVFSEIKRVLFRAGVVRKKQ